MHFQYPLDEDVPLQHKESVGDIELRSSCLKPQPVTEIEISKEKMPVRKAALKRFIVDSESKEEDGEEAPARKRSRQPKKILETTAPPNENSP